MIQYVAGDLFCTPGLDAVAHGVNMNGVMAAGIALEFKQRFPQMHDEYKELCHRGLAALGKVHRFDLLRGPPDYVFNCFTQNKPGPHADIHAVANSVYEVMRQCQFLEIERLGLPMIGAGIGGLKPEDVMEVFAYVRGKWPETDMIVFRHYAKGVCATYE